MLKLQYKTTFNFAFVGKKNYQNRTSRLWNNALKNVVLYEIYSKKLVTEYFLHLSVHDKQLPSTRCKWMLGDRSQYIWK
jgi:hypothetical protein